MWRKRQKLIKVYFDRNAYPWSLESRRKMLSMDPTVSLDHSCPNGRPSASIHPPFLSSSWISMIVCDSVFEFLLFSLSMVDSPAKQDRKTKYITNTFSWISKLISFLSPIKAMGKVKIYPYTIYFVRRCFTI